MSTQETKERCIYQYEDRRCKNEALIPGGLCEKHEQLAFDQFMEFPRDA